MSLIKKMHKLVNPHTSFIHFCALTTTESRVVSTGKISSSSRMTSAADCTNVVVLLFLIRCVLMLPLCIGVLRFVIVL